MLLFFNNLSAIQSCKHIVGVVLEGCMLHFDQNELTTLLCLEKSIFSCVKKSEPYPHPKPIYLVVCAQKMLSLSGIVVEERRMLQQKTYNHLLCQCYNVTRLYVTTW